MSERLEYGAVEIKWTGWPKGITGAILQATEALGDARADTHVTLVVDALSIEEAHRLSLFEALRGLVHSSVLERPGLRANLVFGGSDDDRRQFSRYLATAPYVFGASIDLGRHG
ncbi:hypothetical protein [Sinorhizobium meliloti]|uniref:hypothetical protein n=1 Tax=Rhizobium meliloti TaxID=382 RepID=UPI000FD578AF|nr:hypothetical protein [Sinorhizobium meliloti]MQV24833.1 hypothetical protein [Sinorhizobium meliloti]MQV37497.1 hypothetical protein [Sinorhizobium meliloti]RVE79205.1 hypothetical protein CN240_22745 [Sinorhizobium meliloti]RVG42721.1 hypothetical protein CN227_23980 [Sinorhizobium meliloti]RVM08316.1 hypothetical protein CN125_17390 [Sinorhizobium meliloti]